MVTEKTLIEGAWFAMEQAGRLLRSAVCLYSAGDVGSAVALAMFAREELGRYRILHKLAYDVHKGATLGVQHVRDECNDHLEKQRQGTFSVMYQPNQGERLAEALKAQRNCHPGSAEYKAPQKTIDKEIATIAEEQPKKRHTIRMAAVYVDLAADGRTWKRPEAIDQKLAFRCITDTVNDYALGRQWFNDEHMLSLSDEVLVKIDPKAVLLRKGRPVGLVIPPPVWPSMPG